MLSSVLISVIGFVESIAGAKIYAAKHDYIVSPNRELVALGVCNSIASFFGCFPAFGSLGRSSVNNTAGAKSQLAGFFTVTIILNKVLFRINYYAIFSSTVRIYSESI